MHRLTYMVGKANGALNRYIQRCCGSWGWRAKLHIDPADGNCTPSGFKEYDKRTNGFALTIFAVISGWALADSRNLQLDIVHYAAVSGLPSANFCPRLFRLRNRSVPHVGGGQRADETLSLTVSIRVKGDHSACFCGHMPLYVNSERLLWYPLWMTAAG